MRTGRRSHFHVALEDARSFLWSQFELSAAGAGRLVLVSGGIASGKTALQYDLLDEASDAGALTLSATGAPDEQEIEGAVIDQLLANSSEPVPLDAHASEHGPASAAYVRAVCDGLLGVARDRPTVLCVDDVDFADETSLKLLLQLQRRVRSTKLLVVLGQQDWRRSSHSRLDSFFSRQPGYCSMQLAPMSEPAIGALLRESLDAVDAGLATQLHALSAGNPALANALVDDYRDGDGGGQPVVGDAYERAVHTFLVRPDTHFLDVASGVAVLGTHSSPDLVSALVGLDPELVTEVRRALRDAGLLTDAGFRHPRAEAMVLNGLPPGIRAQLHGDAATLKHRMAASAVEVAGHLVAAGEAADGWAVPVLRRAAEQAMVTDDVQFAIQCLELALSTTTDEPTRRAIKQTLARTTWRVNPSAASPYVWSLREAAAAGTLDRADCFSVMRHALWHGDRATFLLAHETLRRSPEPTDPQAEAELSLGYLWHFGPLPAPAADAPPSHPDGPAHPAAAPWDHAVRTIEGARRSGWSDVTTASAERILQNCRLGDTALEALATAIMSLVRGGLADRAERWCVKLGSEARQRGAITWQAMLESLRARILLRRGEVSCAAERARAALGMLSEPNWGVAIGHPLTTLLVADTVLGAYDDAARTLRRPVPDTMFDTIGGVWYLRACGQFYLATHRPLAAVSDFQRARRLMARWEAEAPTLSPWRSDLAEASLQLGNVAMARDLARQQLDLAIDSDLHSCGLALRVLAHTSPPAEAAVLLEQAVECFQKVGHPLELNRTRQALAQVHAPDRHRRPGVGGPVERPRVAEPKRLPARVVPSRDFAAAAQRVPGLSGGAPAGAATAVRPTAPAPRTAPEQAGDPAVLSEAELRVAQLAALGHTNRQIGSRLFITVSTVEQHLTRAYRKLGIRGRSALAEELRDRAADDV